MHSNQELNKVINNLSQNTNDIKSETEALSQQLTQQFTSELNASHRTNAEHIQRHINNEIKSLHRILNNIATMPSIRLVSAKTLAKDNYFRGGIISHQNKIIDDYKLSEICILQTNGQEMLRSTMLVTKDGGDPIFDSQSLRNTTENESTSNWFTAFKNSNVLQSSFAHFDPDLDGNAAVITLCKQLRFSNNIIGKDFKSADGVLRLSIPLAHIFESLPQSQSHHKHRIIINDSNSQITLYDSSDASNIGDIFSSNGRHIISRSCEDVNMNIHLIPNADIFLSSSEQTDQLAQSLQLKSNTNSSLVTQVSNSIHTSNNLIFTGSIIIAFALAGVIWFLSRSFTEPINTLNQAAHSIAQGDLEKEIAINRKDEIGELANNFNLMRLKLYEQLYELKENNTSLESAMRLKSTFLANMSHEIRTPLNGLLGMAELLYQTELKDEQRDQLQIIQASGQNLLTVINDILDYSKLESENVEMESVTFDPWLLTEDIMQLYAVKAHRKKIDFNSYVDPKIQSSLIGDPHRLQQILGNLISNSIKFTDTGMVYLKVDIAQKNREHCDIRFSVIDTGIGIAKESQSKIFESFNQADVSTTRQFGGTGLGLAICKRLVRVMNSELQIESEKGRGSTFSFVVRFSQGEVIGHISSAYEKEHDHILTVFADPLSNTVIGKYADFFKLTHHQCESTEDINKAIQFISEKNESVAAIIIDLQDTQDAPPFDLFHTYQKYNCIAMNIMEELDHKLLISEGIKNSIYKPIRFKKMKHAILGTVNPVVTKTFRNYNNKSDSNPLQNKRILLAEDNEINKKVICGMLNMWEVDITLAKNGQQAADIYAQDEFDLLLMDCHMPVMDGFASTAAIRDIEKNTQKHTPIIALTANAMTGDRERCLKAGMDDYMSKPVKLEKLQQMLEKWLQVSQTI
ncbi:MAG: response regulator [Planctomycetes bacterium]|nr:response regulator [Planctomycetota bacterium]